MAARGGDLQRSWLAGTLWPDTLQSQALANLRNALLELRRELGGLGPHPGTSETGMGYVPPSRIWQTLC